jgi:hypothetical protein
VERAAGLWSRPAFFSGTRAVDDLDDVDAVQQVVDEGLGDLARHPGILAGGRGGRIGL